MLLFTAIFIGCSDETKSTDSATPPTSLNCNTLDAEECSNQAECFPIVAQAMQGTEDGNFCIDWEAEMENVGCTASGSSLTVETYASPPDAVDSCWYFRSGTIPEGWVECAAVTGECDGQRIQTRFSPYLISSSTRAQCIQRERGNRMKITILSQTQIFELVDFTHNFFYFAQQEGVLSPFK